MADATEIITLKTSMVGSDAPRHAHYDTILDASHGNYYDRVMSSTWKKWEGILYEPGNRPDGRKKLNIIVNLLPQIIEAKRALWSVVPQIRVPYRTLDDADVLMSDQLETAYRCLWQQNRMGEKLGDGGWYAALFGTAIFAVYPDMIAHRPTIVARSPYGFHGVPGNIEQDGTSWKKVMFVTKMRGRQVEAMWPGSKCSDDQLYDVIEYWDEEEKSTVIEQTEKVVAGPIANKMGIVPVVSVPNIAQPGQWWGKGDGDEAITPLNELNKRFNIENQAFSDQAGAPWEAINLDMEAEDVSLDPDAVNLFGPGGSMKKSATGGLPWQLYQSNQQLRQYIDAVTDFPELMRSMFGGSNVSGKALNSLMGPIQARMELRQRYLFPRLEMLNQYAMKMWATYWGGETHMLRGSLKGKRFNLEFKPNDFEGYFENEVYLDSSSYFDVQSKVVIGLQMIAAQGLSIKTFIEKLNPFADDYASENEQIAKEQQERIQLAMMAQMMAQNPMGQNPDVGKPSQDQAGLMQGFQTTAAGPTAPPGVTPEMVSAGASGMEEMATPLTGPMGMGGEETPLEVGDTGTLTRIADAIRSVTTVKGRVFLSGSILSGEIGPEGIEIWFTDMVDWATVRQAVSKQVPESAGKFNPQQGVPTVPFLEVTPGTQGYEPQQPGELEQEGLMGNPLAGSNAPEMMASGGPALPPMI